MVDEETFVFKKTTRRIYFSQSRLLPFYYLFIYKKSKFNASPYASWYPSQQTLEKAVVVVGSHTSTEGSKRERVAATG